MSNHIKVTYDGTDLWVDESNLDHVVCRSDKVQDIVFEVSGTNGQPDPTFEPVGTAAAGFAWISTPPTGVFDEPVRDPKDFRKITLQVTHKHGSAHPGCWIYMLRIRDAGGQVHSTRVSHNDCADPGAGSPCKAPLPNGSMMAAKTISDPNIINR